MILEKQSDKDMGLVYCLSTRSANQPLKYIYYEPNFGCGSNQNVQNRDTEGQKMDINPSLYEILGVQQDADLDAIKRAYRKLVRTSPR